MLLDTFNTLQPFSWGKRTNMAVYEQYHLGSGPVWLETTL